MSPVIPASDTFIEASDAVARVWRARTPQERWAMLATLDADVEAIARAGIAWAHPDYSAAEVEQELFRRRYGDQLTRVAFGLSPSP